MILFKEDWYHYPDAIADTETPNQSFVRFSLLLREMGIENYLFPLQLLDPTLQGVDPFDPNISKENMIKWTIEAKLNVFGFLRECVRDPAGSMYNPIRFRANRYNIAITWLYMNHVTNIAQIGRQQGKSFTADSIVDWLLNCACTNTSIAILTKDDKLRTSNFARIKAIDEELPFFLRRRGKGDIANTEEIKISALDNTCTGYVPQSSPKLALNVGRGSTNANVFIDEAPYLSNIGISLPVLLATGNAAKDIAKQKGEPYGTIIYSTAGLINDRDGSYIYGLINRSAIWNERFYDTRDQDDLYNVIRKNSPKGELRVYTSFTHRQLGYTDAWLKSKLEENAAEGDDALRDFFGVWTAGTSTSPLSKDLAELVRASVVNDYYSEISSPYGYVTRWYIPKDEIKRRMESSHYVMGLDTSDAAGGDDIAMVIRDVKTGEIIAAGNYNETNLITFSEWLCIWLSTYRNLTIIIERRSTGSMILDYLLLMLPARQIDPFTRLYNKVIQEADEYPERYKDAMRPMFSRSNDVYVKYKRLFGFATSATGATSRTELYSSTLLSSVKMTGDSVRDSRVIDQILGLVITPAGRVDHQQGGHDDLVIAFLLSYWMITKGKGLSSYGISPRDVMVNNQTHQVINDPKVLYEQQQQSELRQQLDVLSEQIRTEPNDYMVHKLESRLRHLMSQIRTSDVQEVVSVDTLINNLREARRQTRTHSRTFGQYGYG